MPSKLGITHGKKLEGSFQFGAVVDGITFGIINGKPFDIALNTWIKEDRVKWAEGSAIYFETFN